jgi:signal transduction histidine kinase
MLSDLAHEMRTPLATIDAHLEAVEDGVRDLDGSTLEVIGTSTARLRRLAEDIGAVSRAEEGGLTVDRVVVPAAEVARAVAAAAADRYDAQGVALVVDVAGEPPVVRIDPDRIGQVLGNLLDNALRHTPAGGTVTLTCRAHDGGVEYAVSDTGSGIAAEHLDHLFDRFYRADTARDRLHGGSGIGLSIAKALVDAHGGSIGAESAGPGHGSTFRVLIPGDPR